MSEIKEYRSQEEVGREIARLRKERGLTQPELAASLGMDQSALSRVENGGRGLSIGELVAIAQQLDVEPEALLSECPVGVAWRAEASSDATREAVGIVNEVLADFFAFEAVGR